MRHQSVLWASITSTVIGMFANITHAETKQDQQTAASKKTYNTAQKQSANQFPWLVGVGTIISPSPYKDTPASQLTIPIISYRGQNLTIAGPYLSFTVLDKGWTKTDLRAYLFPESFNPDHSTNQQIKALDRRDYTIMAGARQSFKTPYGLFGISLDGDITGRSQGYTAALDYRLPVPIIFNQKMLLVTPSVGLMYLSKSLSDYYYGISDQEASVSGLAAYTPKASFSPYLSTRMMFVYHDHWSISGSVQLNFLNQTITHSPIIDDQVGLTSMLTLGYRF